MDFKNDDDLLKWLQEQAELEKDLDKEIGDKTSVYGETFKDRVLELLFNWRCHREGYRGIVSSTSVGLSMIELEKALVDVGFNVCAVDLGEIKGVKKVVTRELFRLGVQHYFSRELLRKETTDFVVRELMGDEQTRSQKLYGKLLRNVDFFLIKSAERLDINFVSYFVYESRRVHGMVWLLFDAEGASRFHERLLKAGRPDMAWLYARIGVIELGRFLNGKI